MYMTTKKRRRTRRGIRRRCWRPQVGERGYLLDSAPRLRQLGADTGQPPSGHRLSQTGHEGEGPGQVVDGEEAGNPGLADQMEMAKVGPRPAPAHAAGARRVQGTLVLPVGGAAQR